MPEAQAEESEGEPEDGVSLGSRDSGTELEAQQEADEEVRVHSKVGKVCFGQQQERQ